MKKTFLTIVISFSALFASNLKAESNRSFCAKRKSSYKLKKIILSSSDRLSFRNQGGLLNAGVCWWHSRFQRNAMMVAVFKPLRQRPTAKEVKKIVKQIRKANSVVVVPGFSDLSEFSYYHENAIQRELEKWQKGDGILRQQWIIGLAGASTVSENSMKIKMDKLYQYVNVEKNIAYQKLQIKGIDAHAWLVLDIKKISGGYKLTIMDSNYSYPQDYTYKYGMKSFHHSYFGNFVPYTGRKREFSKAKKAIAAFCK